MKIGKSHIVTLAIFAIIAGSITFQQFTQRQSEKRAKEQMMIPPTVEVAEIEEKTYNQQSESTGRINAKYSVDVVARINGWLEKRYFEEGAFVKKGQVLFKIEPKEYILAVAQAQAAARQAEATLINAEKELARAAELVKNDYVSKSYYDNALATRDQCKAVYDMRKAELDDARRNLEYTEVRSPIDGKIGTIYITEGNLVNPSIGRLATIVSNDPIYIDYSLKSNDYVKYRRMQAGNLESSKVSVKLVLADGEEYEHPGKIESIDNVVDETTGTIKVRTTFPNPDNMLVPGDFVTVKLKVEDPITQKLVPQKAVLKAANCSYVFVINDVKDPKTGKVQSMASVRKIEIGKPIDDNWEIISGLDIGERVAVSGLTNIRLAPTAEDPNKKDEKQTQPAPQADQQKGFIAKIQTKFGKKNNQQQASAAVMTMQPVTVANPKEQK